MQTLYVLAQGYYESKGSKFLSFLAPFNEYDDLCNALRIEHPKAVHFVRASRYLNDFEQIIESCDDDKEPKGSSGLPSLNVLRGEAMINVGLVIVRYFGGHLLGVGGLVRAYTSAAQEAIKTAKTQNLLQPFVALEDKVLEIPYNTLCMWEEKSRKMDLTLYKEAFLAQSVRVRIKGDKARLSQFLAQYIVQDSIIR